jgi:hypothetical protein
VQTLETWLLWIRGYAFPGVPEQWAHRSAIKKAFFGKPLPPEGERALLALEQVNAPHALDRLRERRSFRAFEEQILSWL